MSQHPPEELGTSSMTLVTKTVNNSTVLDTGVYELDSGHLGSVSHPLEELGTMLIDS